MVRPYEVPTAGGPPPSRREQLLAEAARLFATRGFRGVGIEDLGAAVGISGPAIYRHFASKEEILATLLVGISRHLHDGGVSLRGQAAGRDLLERLITFHLDFSLNYPGLIVLHDRDLDSLEAASRDEVRGLQRTYVGIWTDALQAVCPQVDPVEARVRAHACFGLLNATPHLPDGTLGPSVRRVLGDMAIGALLAGAIQGEGVATRG